MAVAATIVIEVDEKGAIASLNNLNQAGNQLGPSLQKTGETNNVVMTKMVGQYEKGREAAELLSNTLGVHLPRSLQKVLAESQTIGPALAGAFNAAAIAGFAFVAINAILSVVENIKSLDNAMAQFRLDAFKAGSEQEISLLQSAQEKSRELQVRAQTATANELLKLDATYHTERQKLLDESLSAEQASLKTGETDVVQKINANLLALDKAHAAEKKALLLQEAADIRNARDQEVAANKLGIDRILADEKTAKDQIDSLVESGKKLYAVGQAEKAAIHAQTLFKIEEADRAHKQLVDSARNSQFQAELQAEASAAAGKQALDAEYLISLEKIKEQEDALQKQFDSAGIKEHVEFNLARVAADKDYNNKVAELAQQRADEETQINTEAAIAMLRPWQRADAQIVADAEARIQKIREMEAKDNTFREQGEREVSAVIQKEWADRVDSMASQLEGLYNDITNGGIGKFFVEQFKKMVFRMVAEWIIGMGQMRAASQQQMGSGGGFLGAIFGSLGLGGIFGGGSGGSGGGAQGGISGLPGVITNFMGGGTASASGSSGDIGNLPLSIPGLGISAGMGGGLPGGVLPSGSNPASGIGGILSKIFHRGVTIGGVQLSSAMLAAAGAGLVASNFMGGGILHALGGAAGGALIGLPFGPAGVIIGAIAGFISGLIGHSTKKARLQIEANIKAQAQAIEDGYDLFQADWTSSRSALEALRQQGVDALKQAGVKDISRSRVGHVDHWIDKAEKEIDATQAERNARSALSFGPPQFRVGGFVGPGIGGAAPAWFTAGAMHFAGGGAVPAILHEGEFVMRPEAVARYGVGTLNRMNSGSGSNEIHYHIQVSALDAKSVSQLFRRMQLEGSW